MNNNNFLGNPNLQSRFGFSLQAMDQNLAQHPSSLTPLHPISIPSSRSTPNNLHSSSISKTGENNDAHADSINIRLCQSRNKHYISFLNWWCKSMSKEEVVAVLARHNPNSRSSFEKRIKVNSHGDFFIDKLIMDAFIFYSSETLFVPRRSASSCNFSECSRAAEYGFDGMKSSLCAEHKLKGMRVKGNILCKWCNRLTRENEKLSVRLTGRYKISEQFRKQASRLRKRLQESNFKKKKTLKLRIFNTLGLSEKKKRVAICIAR